MLRRNSIEQQPYNLKQLTKNIAQYFDLGELALLCLSLDIRYDQIAGDTIDTKAYNLVLYFERRMRLDELVAECKKERPKADWGDKPPVRSLEDEMARRFNYSELEELCFIIKIDLQQLATPMMNLRELINLVVRHCRNQAKFDLLIEECNSLRPYTDWNIYKD